MSKPPIDERRWQEINAMVDGELDRARVAQVAAWIARDQEAARAFESIATLSATTAGLAGKAAGRPGGRSLGARGALFLALGIAAGAALAFLAFPGVETPDVQIATLSPRSLGLSDEVTIGDIRLPNLQRGGLRLERVGVVEDRTTPRLEAAYVGERGCRVRLVVAAAADIGDAVPASPAPQESRWRVGGYVYTMTSERMDPQRFVAVAVIAQAETVPGSATQLANAAPSASKRPCLG